MPVQGQRITVTDVIQGVTQFMVEIAIDGGGGYGAYAELTEIDPETGLSYSDSAGGIFYNSPSVIIGSGDTERRRWSFDFGYTIGALLVEDDKFKFRFTPAGWDLGNGPAFESAEYTVTAAGIGIRQRTVSPILGVYV